MTMTPHEYIAAPPSHESREFRTGLDPRKSGGSHGDVFANADFCWPESLPASRNLFVSFLREFEWTGDEPVIIHLFADTRYRLWVNEKFAHYGPGKFVTAFPEYDSLNITQLLEKGCNRVRVEVNYYGCSSFQTMRDGRPGFIASGGTECERDLFATPQNWVCLIHTAWSSDAPLFSFAQNPVEICDTRVLATELACEKSNGHLITPQALDASARVWRRLSPRSVPLPQYQLMHPKRVLVAAPLAPQRLWAFQIRSPAFHECHEKGEALFVSFLSWAFSPRKQSVPMGCFWCEIAVNDEPLRIEYSSELGNHGSAIVELNQGWNCIKGSCRLLLEHWPVLLSFPPESGVELHARPDREEPNVFLISPVTFATPLPHPPCYGDDFALPAGWRFDDGSVAGITPARLVSWDEPLKEDGVNNVAPNERVAVSIRAAEGALWCYDFSDQYYGHPVLDVEAPAGTVLDVAYDDWKRPDGCVNLYHSNPFTDAADRFILRGGRQKIEVLNPRGGIFLQIVLRPPKEAGVADLSVHSVAVRRRTVLAREDRFSCGDELYEWIWEQSLHTLACSADETFSDCPWRERACYIGDALVNIHLNALMACDLPVARRSLELLGQAQLADGQLPCCAPSWLEKPHEDYSLLWIVAVRDMITLTGDVEWVASQWPTIERILASPTWQENTDGLWDAVGTRLFIDWGVLLPEREGQSNAVLNILRFAALDAAATIAGALGNTAAQAQLMSDREALGVRIMSHLWVEAEGRFLPSASQHSPAIHANILALRYGIGPADRLIGYLEPHLRDNLNRGRRLGAQGGHAELYFFYFLLPALAAHGRFDLAEFLLREHYGFLRSLGYPTLPETFYHADKGEGSCCHSWSGAGAIYLAQNVLGVRHVESANPDRILFDPRTTLDGAEGKILHRLGMIRVQWQRGDAAIAACLSIPHGLTVESSPGIALKIEHA